jgi:hypothetical protein
VKKKKDPKSLKLRRETLYKSIAGGGAGGSCATAANTADSDSAVCAGVPQSYKDCVFSNGPNCHNSDNNSNNCNNGPPPPPLLTQLMPSLMPSIKK